MEKYIVEPEMREPLVLETGVPTSEEIEASARANPIPEDKTTRFTREGIKSVCTCPEARKQARNDPDAMKYGNMTLCHYLHIKDYVMLNEPPNRWFRLRAVSICF